MAKATDEDRPRGFVATVKQIALVFRLTAKRDRIFLPLVIGVLVLAAAIAVVLFLFVKWIAIAFGLLLGLTGVLITLNLRANKAFMSQIEGEIGAAATIVENMRGDWRITPGVAATTDMQTAVHLVVCRAGVVLIGEGQNEARVRSLLNGEKRRFGKVIGTTEMREIIIGHGEGQVPVRKLRMALMKLPRTLTKTDVAALDRRLKALTARPQMPKGAIPKNMRPPRGQFRATRGR
jgi:hypothetical protein